MSASEHRWLFINRHQTPESEYVYYRCENCDLIRCDETVFGTRYTEYTDGWIRLLEVDPGCRQTIKKERSLENDIRQ